MAIRRKLFIIVHHVAAGTVSASNNYKGFHYDFLVLKDGSILPRRNINIRGSHCIASNMNEKALSVSFADNFSLHAPSKRQLEGAAKKIRELMERFNIPIGNVLGHKDVKYARTACPGSFFNMNSFRLMLKQSPDPAKPMVNAKPVHKVLKPIISSVLKWGDKGKEVKSLQKLLNDLSFYCGKADGIFGKNTFNALILFQSLRNLKPIGTFDASTHVSIVSKKKYGIIKKGDKGQDVKVIQKLLTRHYRHCIADGVFGRITKIQVSRFQRDKKLSIDGIVGFNTVKELLK